MKCPRCGANLPAGAANCGNCGAKFQTGKRCPNCQNLIPANAAACPKCGAKFGGQAAASPGQNPPKARGSFRWWRIPIYIVVFAVGIGVGCAYMRYSILSNVRSAFNQFMNSSSSQSESKPTASPSSQSESSRQENPDSAGKDSGNLGNYEISILSARRSVDYEGNPAIIVKYQFTNKSNENQNFMTAVSAKAFQKGVQLNSAVIIGDEQYTALDSTKDVQPNGTIELEKAYLVTDTTSDIVIEVTELFSLSDDKLSKNFPVSSLQ